MKVTFAIHKYCFCLLGFADLKYKELVLFHTVFAKIVPRRCNLEHDGPPMAYILAFHTNLFINNYALPKTGIVK